MRIIAVLAIGMLWAGTLGAAGLSGTFSVLIENDKFTGTDRHYTNGLELNYLSPKDEVPNWLRSVARVLPGVTDAAALRAGFSLGQSIFTPDDVDTSQPLPNERPYAGWLYGGLTVVAETESRLDSWELNLGVVGPSAGGEEVQNNFHKLIGVEEANGWGNQLGDEFGATLTYERKWRNLAELRRSGYGIDLTPTLGGSIGNVGTYLNAGMVLRVGKDLPSDFGPPRIRPSLAGSAFFLPRDKFGWYLFAGIDARAVAYNIFLDGNTRQDSLSVSKRPLVGDLQAGLVVTVGGVRLAYTYIFRTKEFKDQDRPDEFGAISLSLKF